ncbi:MAG: hypothetical protein QXX84_06980 [Sulfolobales archaeon]
MELVATFLVIFVIERITTYLLWRKVFEIVELVLDRGDWLPFKDSDDNGDEETPKEIKGFAGGE